MRLYKRYIFQKLLRTLLITVITIASAIWLTKVIRLLEFITEEGVGVLVFLKLSLYLLPSLLIFIVPLSIFFTVMGVYNKLVENHEITILQNTGITKFSIAKPAIFLSIIASIFCYIAVWYVIPKFNNDFRFLKRNIRNSYSSIVFDEGTFSRVKNITIYVNKKDEQGNLYGLMIYDNAVSDYMHMSEDDKHTLVSAQKAHVFLDNNNNRILKLFSGNIQKFYGHNKVLPETIYFEEYAINLDNYKVRRMDPHKKLSNLNLLELYSAYRDGYLLYTEQNIMAEIHYRLTFPLLSLIFACIGCVFILNSNFDRVGGKKVYIRNASVFGILFMSVCIYLYKIIETNNIFVPVLYSLIGLTIMLCLVFLNEVKLKYKIRGGKKK